MTSKALNVRQAAEYLSVSTSTIYAQARAGVLPAHRIGKSWRFFAAELNESTRIDPWIRSARSASALERIKRRPQLERSAR